MNPQDIQPSDEVWYKGVLYVVLAVKDDIATLFRHDSEEGRIELQGELMHMSKYVPMNEREEPPDDQ